MARTARGSTQDTTPSTKSTASKRKKQLDNLERKAQRLMVSAEFYKKQEGYMLEYDEAMKEYSATNKKINILLEEESGQWPRKRH